MTDCMISEVLESGQVLQKCREKFAAQGFVTYLLKISFIEGVDHSLARCRSDVY